MKKEDFFNDDFLKEFKSDEELTNFLKQLQKRGQVDVSHGRIYMRNSIQIMVTISKDR